MTQRRRDAEAQSVNKLSFVMARSVSDKAISLIVMAIATALPGLAMTTTEFFLSFGNFYSLSIAGSKA